MFKGKILISILTGAITLTSAGMATIITNPSASSEWLSQRFSAFNLQDSAEKGENEQDEWFETTVPDEARLLAVTPAPTTDASTSASIGDDDDWDEDDVQTGDASLGTTDVVASASIPAEETGSTGTAGSYSRVDVVASASIPAGESGSTGSTGSSSSVDVIASASKPGSSSTVSTEGLISLEKAIEIARTRVGDATYKGYELDDDYPPVYELYFVKGQTGYEVEIHAVNGTILEIDSETAYLEEHDDDDDDRDDDDDDDDDRDDDDDDDDDRDDDDDDEEDDD